MKLVIKYSQEMDVNNYLWTLYKFDFDDYGRKNMEDRLLSNFPPDFHAVKGQNWQGALSHINRKSVDFVLCDKSYISPKLAIELDDKSHQQEDRKTRDQELERILAEAGIPLLRLENHGSFDSAAIQKQIQEKIEAGKL